MESTFVRLIERFFCALYKKRKIAYAIFLVGAGGFGPPKLSSSRFTVCPLWPLGNAPLFSRVFLSTYNIIPYLKAFVKGFLKIVAIHEIRAYRREKSKLFGLFADFSKNLFTNRLKSGIIL